MLKDILEAKPLPKFHLHLRFDDGVEGTVDISNLIEFTGVFAPLQDERYFAQVRVNPEWGTVYWPNGADLDPDVLYSLVFGKPLPTLETALAEKPGS